MANKITRWYLKWAHNKNDYDDLDVSNEQSRMDDEDLLSSEVDNDGKIEVLRQAGIKCKSSFVTLKHNLMYLVSDDRNSAVPVDRKCVQEALDAMLDAQETSVNLLTELSQLYRRTGNMEMMQRVSDDMELIHCESSEAQNEAFKCVCSSNLSNSNTQNQKNDDLDEKIALLQGELDHLRDECEGYKNDFNASKSTGTDANSPFCNHTAVNEPQIQQIGNDLWNQLERVSIPVFTGDKMTYEGWRAAFDACVDEAPVSSVYKLLQLKKYLSGEPLHLIERLGHSAEAYEVAKSKLDRKYGGKRRQTARYHLNGARPISNERP